MKGSDPLFSWLTANLGTVLIVLLLAAVVIGILVKLRKDRKKGSSVCGCSCGCEHCAMRDSCHQR